MGIIDVDAKINTTSIREEDDGIYKTGNTRERGYLLSNGYAELS